MYGTTKSPVSTQRKCYFYITCKSNKNKKLNYKLITFYYLQVKIYLKGLIEIERQMIANERMKEFEVYWINYDYVIINDDLENAAKGLLK